VLVVLGAAVRPGGVPSAALQRRIEHAVRLARQRSDALLLLTGGVGLHPPSEAEVMARLAEQGGVARERMLLEDRATNTRESARNCAALLREWGDCDVWLVTDAYHQRRARLAFRRAGLPAQAASPMAADASRSQRASPSQRAKRFVREWVGLAWYWLTFRG
jgi:uncharacterized SAM-binding protein YcdF (DUF218 family)